VNLIFESSSAKCRHRSSGVAFSYLTCLLVSVLLLSGCDRGKIEKLEAENAGLKVELEKVKEQIQELAALQKSEAAKRNQEEARQRAESAEREQQEAIRKQAIEAQEQKAKAEVASNKVKSIESCFERINLRMNALLESPRNFSYQTKPEREQTETKLKAVANTKKEEIGEIIIELKGLGFDSVTELKGEIDLFMKNYGQLVFYQRLSADYSTFDSDQAFKEAKKAENYLSQSYANIRTVLQLKRDATKKSKSDEAAIAN